MESRHVQRMGKGLYVGLSLILFVIACAFMLPWRTWYEDVSYTIDPSAARAFAYGEHHFNAKNAADYDIHRAEYFLLRAAAKDPSLPYVFHELARVAFLRGDFNTALARMDMQISLHGSRTANSYYVRGLIEGFKGDYEAAVRDYERYIGFDPMNWAALNDLAWVLLKAERFREAAEVAERGLRYVPDNPWLLNSDAIALFELGDVAQARVQAQAAVQAAAVLTEEEWLRAYPGNDPRIAGEGVAAFREATMANMHRIEAAISSGTVQ